jgi:VCBS repeat-containing protein
MIVPADGTCEWWPEKTPDPLNSAYGSVTVNADGSFVYIPDLEYAGQGLSDSFQYLVSDGDGGTVLCTAHLQLT